MGARRCTENVISVNRGWEPWTSGSSMMAKFLCGPGLPIVGYAHWTASCIAWELRAAFLEESARALQGC
eukprot:11449239-Karenia_brevis.AAC.1